jgi:hypothetical protein
MRTEVASEGSNVFSIERVNFFDAIEDFEKFVDKVMHNPALTREDATALRETLQLSDYVSARAATDGVNVSALGKSVDVNVAGCDAYYPYVSDIPLSQGRHVTEIDDRENAQVALLGWDVYTSLLAPREPVGSTVRIGNRHFRVVGVAAQRGKVLGQSRDRFVIVPLGAYRKVFGPNQSVEIQIAAGDIRVLQDAMDEATVAMRIRHGLRPREGNDFAVSSSEQLISLWKSISRGIMAALVALVGVSMLVGGIVLMNTMIVSVTERHAKSGCVGGGSAAGGDHVAIPGRVGDTVGVRRRSRHGYRVRHRGLGVGRLRVALRRQRRPGGDRVRGHGGAGPGVRNLSRVACRPPRPGGRAALRMIDEPTIAAESVGRKHRASDRGHARAPHALRTPHRGCRHRNRDRTDDGDGPLRLSRKIYRDMARQPALRLPGAFDFVVSGENTEDMAKRPKLTREDAAAITLLSEVDASVFMVESEGERCATKARRPHPPPSSARPTVCPSCFRSPSTAVASHGARSFRARVVVLAAGPAKDLFKRGPGRALVLIRGARYEVIGTLAARHSIFGVVGYSRAFRTPRSGRTSTPRTTG